MVAFMHKKIDWLDWHQEQTLANLGFNLGYHAFSPYSWNSIRDNWSYKGDGGVEAGETSIHVTVPIIRWIIN